MLFPVKQICYIIVFLATNYEGMASAALVIKKGEHIDVYSEQILVHMNIVN